MQADIGGGRLVIAHLPRRRARAHLFSVSGRGLLAAGLAAAALIGLGLVGGRTPDAASATLNPYAWIGR